MSPTVLRMLGFWQGRASSAVDGRSPDRRKPRVLSRSKTMPLGAMGSALSQGALGQGLAASGGTASAGTTSLSALSTSSKLWGRVQKVTLKQQPVSIFSVEALTSWRAIAMLIYRLEFSVAFSRLVTKLKGLLFRSSLSHIKTVLSGGPMGAVGQYGAVTSKVIKRSLHPVWRQRLELRLEGGVLSEDGEYDNKDAPYTSLRIELWDHDLLSRDDFIGEVRLPLGPLMDGRVHTYTLPLTDPEGKSQAEDAIGGTTITFELAFDD